ncbi:MAG TPA: DUF1415 family protein [Polyangiaceae bacterium]|jgi:hypothetical protein|nr:DUF1415 family protein [Polyangiaceae bacterium]
MDDEALRGEAIRLYRRYETEIVEALKLCPWAERARLDGRVREHVLFTTTRDAEPPLDAIATLADDPSVEIGLLIFPKLRIAFEDFERFVSSLVTKDSERRELGTAPFALAAFHPDARADLSDPERTIPFLRRTPDPTIQLVRYDVLERVREGFNEGTQFIDAKALMTLDLTREETLPLRERIARSNHRTLGRIGVDVVEQRFASIFEDRDAAYGSRNPRTLPR